MTDFSKIEAYYSQFNEWNRLNTPEGQVELAIILDLIEKYSLSKSVVLDLGGGPGRYTVELSNRDRTMYLADLSPILIQQAKNNISKFGTPQNVISTEIVNALDLSFYKSSFFDAILLFGPLYHLTNIEEIEKCISEVKRVLKPGGTLFSIYIPWATGINHILDRLFSSPGQVSSKVIEEMYAKGVFNNQTNSGFQEGKYITSHQLRDLFSHYGFSEILNRSIRSIAYQKENKFLETKNINPELYKGLMQLLENMSIKNEIIETCGHAIFIHKKIES